MIDKEKRPMIVLPFKLIFFPCIELYRDVVILLAQTITW